jgi:acid phosphatase
VSADTLSKIEHIVIIYGENRSFDNLYGLFPGANGVQNLTPEQYLQTDHDGKPFTTLPPVWSSDRHNRHGVDHQFASKPPLPNQPFRLDAPPYNLPLNVPTRDLAHRYYENRAQINGGKMDRFAAVSDAGGLVMGYYDGSPMQMWQLARTYTLADNFFMAAFGGSFLNHFWLICACTPVAPNAPPSLVSAVQADGMTLQRKPASPPSARDGAPQWAHSSALTPDFYAVNTMQPPYQPSGIPPATGSDLALADPAKHPLPPQMLKTIGDTLSAKGVHWAWYAGAWNLALADGMQPPSASRQVIYTGKDGAPNFQAHHQPFNYFTNYAPGTQPRAEHLKDGSDFLQDVAHGTLPAVAFYKPQGTLNQHPGYAEIMTGDAHIAAVIAKIQQSPQWDKTLIIVTYDENGGLWDHVPPPPGDRWGPGVRIPAILISPWVKKGYVDHTQYDTTSILKFITKRFSLEPLPGVRTTMGDLTSSLLDE